MEQKIINLIKLNYNLDDFFAITVYDKMETNLHGYYTDEKYAKYSQMGYDLKLDNLHFTGTKDNITITLSKL